MTYEVGDKVWVDCDSGFGSGPTLDEVKHVEVWYETKTGEPYTIVQVGDQSFYGADGRAVTPPFAYHIEPADVVEDFELVAVSLVEDDSIPFPTPEKSYQGRVGEWLLACFGEEIAGDKIERNHRFLEESLELVQACGCTKDEALQLVDYVYGRPVGVIAQEVGGVMTTVTSLCRAWGINLERCAEDELARVWTKIEQIRAKQAAKPKHGPLAE